MENKTSRAKDAGARKSGGGARKPAGPAGHAAGNESVRTGLSAESLRRAVLDHLAYNQARLPAFATRHDWYVSLALAVRDRLLERWGRTLEAYTTREVKVAAYLSAEFLIGPQLGSNLLCLGIEAEARQAMADLGQDLDDLLEVEEEPGLGNGGLGRLAACYMDSLATLERPAIGYGIRYEFGIFDQQIRDGWQVEVADTWLRRGNPWEIPRPDVVYDVKLGGRTEHGTDEQGRYRVRWIPHRVVQGTPYDIPVPGFRVGTCNTLRLWSARAGESFDFQAFNQGGYWEAVDDKVVSETITKVLYPNDEPEVGKKLRLAQQYFFVSCSLQDMLRLLDRMGEPFERFPDEWAVQLNDTHPAVAVAELMRLLVDERLVDWDSAWDITRRTFGYTNHTLLPEALETWPLPLFRELLPRHVEILCEINQRFLDEVREQYPGDEERIRRLSLFDETGEKRVRMANLACVGSHSINGVAELHTQLLRRSVLRDFAELWPDRFRNVTNGVTPRRFLALCNPGLRDLVSGAIGEGWIRDLGELRRLEPFAEDAGFRREWRAVRRGNKDRLARIVRHSTGVEIEPDWLYDVQVKRIHEYKRQHMNVLHVITRYLRLKADPALDVPPRVWLFAGKAAPGYFMAKRIIKLIHGVAETVNSDPETNRRMRVAFLPDFNVKHAHPVYPAADLSEQISLAGKEASGTGNMKFAMNGALTIGTLDGANVEIREEAGADHFFLFGMTAEEAARKKREGYRPGAVAEANPELGSVLHAIAAGRFSGGDTEVFRPVVQDLLGHDEYMVLADYSAYVECQEAVDDAWRDTDRWTRMSIRTAARMGKFSSDRAIREYCEAIWEVHPVPVPIED